MPLGADPVAAPRRRQLIVRARFLEAGLPQRLHDVEETESVIMHEKKLAAARGEKVEI